MFSNFLLSLKIVVHYVDVVRLTDDDDDKGESEDESETESERGKNGKTDSTAAAAASELCGCRVSSQAPDSQLNCLRLMRQNC